MYRTAQKMKEAAVAAALEQAMKYMSKDPEENIPKIMALVDKILPEDWYKEQRQAIWKAIKDKGNWYELIMKIWDLDPDIRDTFVRNFIIHASLSGSAKQETLETEEGSKRTSSNSRTENRSL